MRSCIPKWPWCSQWPCCQLHIIFFVALLVVCPLLAQGTSDDELPDDYLPFTLHQLDDRLEGESEFLKGYTISMDLSREMLGNQWSKETLFALVRDFDVIGTLTYPDGRTAPIWYEIVHYRGTEDIYMKSSLGYFLLEYMTAGCCDLNFAIYWWYHPPATEADVQIILKTEQLLSDPDDWHKDDDRECSDDFENNLWSLFCALKYSSLEIAGEYNHHNTAIQTTRFVIDKIVPDHEFAHTLMDYNNTPTTTHEDILCVLALSKKRIRRELLETTEKD